jgi:electron transport complex protein RnfC
MPLVERCVTVDGTAVAQPQNVLAPIGTPVSDILQFAGGLTNANYNVIMGGPMTGHALRSLSEPVVKTTNAITVLTQKETVGKKITACIHCGKCVEACPNSLNPTAFVKALKAETVDEQMAMLEDACLLLCIECGCCAYVCPAARPLAEQIRIAKNSLREYQAHKANLK